MSSLTDVAPVTFQNTHTHTHSYLFEITTATLIVSYKLKCGHLVKPSQKHDFILFDTDWAFGLNPVECDGYERLGKEERKSSGREAKALEKKQRGPLPGLQIEL